MNPNQDNKNNKGGQGPKKRGFFVGALVWALVLVIIFNFIAGEIANAGTKEVTYSEFIQMVENNEVATAELANKQITFYLSKDLPAGITQPSGQSSDQDLAKVLAEQMEKGGATCYITAPPQGQGYRDDDLLLVLKQHNVAYAFTMEKETSLLMNMLLSYVLPVVIMTGALIFIMRRMGGPGGLGGVGKSNAKVYMEKSTGITFADVAGQDEAKESLVEIIDFLHNPQKYAAIGAKLPKGALLVGPPGTGKTLLAKAVAGEASVPFFSISGSDFVEMFVGVGASRVRDLFQQAAKVAPAIIFIDEIDAIGRTRDSKFGGNDEREQTLNQLLAEIDGFDSSKGVVILAATNRPEILDKALLRAGRFDRRIIVDRPNLAGRYQTLRVHTKNIKLAEDVDLHKIAQATAGAVGADLANLVNEAALRAVRMGRKAVNQQDLLTSFELVIAGTEKKGTVLTDTEKRIVSYHEVGHALVAALQKHSQPVSKITIVPHTSGALGYTMQMPEEEKFLSSKEELIVELQTMLGGRAAEQVVFGIATTGASNDIERATELARKMVTQYGMSDKLGLMALSTVSNPYLDGSTMMNCADSTSSAADEEIHKLLMDCYADAKKLLVEHRSLLDEIAMYLLSKETITGDEFMAYVNADSKKLTDGSEAEEPPEQTEAPSESE